MIVDTISLRMGEELQSSIYCKHPDNLSYDEACLNVYSHNYKYPFKLYYQYENCHNCDFLEWATIVKESNTSLIVKTTDRVFFRVNGHDNDLCSQNYTFGQHGIYGWNITQNGCSSVYNIKSPDNPYYPLYVFLGSIFCFVLFNIVLQTVSKSQWFRRIQRSISSTSTTDDDGQETPTSDSAQLVPSELVPAIQQLQQTRVNSLDAFRGITIALMIFVNYGGGKYWFFQHSPWNGLTAADIVFPWFAWIMGVGIALSVRSKLRSGSGRSSIIYAKVFVRVEYLIILGLFFSNIRSNNLTTFRFPGVLQRLAFSYLIVAFLESILMKRQPNFQYGRWVILQDILDSWAQWITIIFIVAAHTAITFHLPVPGCPTGYLGPGGLHDHKMYQNCTGGAAGYIDRRVFGNSHIYQHPSSVRVYHSDIPFDPEGILGVLTTTLTVYLGVAAGRIILCSNSTEGRVKRWAIYAIVTGLISGFLCNWSKEEGLIPINKNLWSLSFVFVTASLAFSMMIILYLIVDHYKIWAGSPFSEAGMNSILIYIGHALTKDSYPFSYTPIDKHNHNDYFIQNVIATTIWIAIAVRLHKKEIFFTV